MDEENSSENEAKEDTAVLGGNIQLTGFRDLDGGSMVILKKIVGNYARRFSEICEQFELLKVSLKSVHEKEKSEKYELHAMVTNKGKNYTAEMTERNLFFALDIVLKKIESEISK